MLHHFPKNPRFLCISNLKIRDVVIRSEILPGYASSDHVIGPEGVLVVFRPLNVFEATQTIGGGAAAQASVIKTAQAANFAAASLCLMGERKDFVSVFR